ncbi:MAG: hypothetical protein OXN89_25290 [Bryobacterales bacterium]|nr:hypothetical protein [Bryobacterales bacterium]
MILRSGSLLLGALVALAPTSFASNLALDAPVLGYVFDGDSGELHRINGLLGSSSLSDAIGLQSPVSRASVSTNQRFAIVQDGDGRTLLVDLTVEPPSATELEGVMDGAEGVLFGPSGLVAAFYAKDRGLLQFVDGLGSSPTVGSEIDGLDGLGSISGLALSDSGSVLVATSGGGGGSLYMLPRRARAQRVGSVQEASGLTFLRGEEDAIIADGEANEVIFLRSYGMSWHAITVATENDGLNRPYLAGATGDGSYAVVAVPGGVMSIPLYGGAVSFADCACSPTGLTPLLGGNAFLLTSDPRQPLLAVEVGEEPRVRFIPALPLDDPVATF